MAFIVRDFFLGNFCIGTVEDEGSFALSSFEEAGVALPLSEGDVIDWMVIRRPQFFSVNYRNHGFDNLLFRD